MVNPKLSSSKEFLGRVKEHNLFFRMDEFKSSIRKVQIDLGAEYSKKLGEPGGMRGPGRSGHEVAVGDGVRHREIDVRAAGLRHLRTDGGIRAALFSLDGVRRGQNLRAVSEWGHGCFRLLE